MQSSLADCRASWGAGGGGGAVQRLAKTGVFPPDEKERLWLRGVMTPAQTQR